MIRPAIFKRRDGFTLLEMLVVIAIIGLLAAIGFNSLGTYRASLRVRDAQAQVTTAAERARSLARRYGQNYRLTVSNVNGRAKYSVVPYNAAWTAEATDVPALRDQLLPEGFAFSNTTALEMNFIGPLARLQTTGCIGITFASSNLSAVVNLVGVTGKVIPRAVQQNTTPCS
jgi:type IV pilus assembly protein PilA